MAALDASSGHKHTGGANDAPPISPATALVIASQATGDILYASSATAWARLAKGTAYYPLCMNSGATAPEWAQIVAAGIASDAITNVKILDDTIDLTAKVTGTLPVAKGGTNRTSPMTASGTYSGSANAQNVAHGLGRTPVGIVICQTNSNDEALTFWTTGMTKLGPSQGITMTIDATNIGFGSGGATGNTAGRTYYFTCW